MNQGEKNHWVLMAMIERRDFHPDVIRNELGIMWNERSNVMPANLAVTESMPDLQVSDVLRSMVAEVETPPLRAASFQRTSKPVSSKGHKGFILRHYEKGACPGERKMPKELFNKEAPGYHHATLEESWAFVQQYPKISHYFDIVLLGTTWHHDKLRKDVVARWSKGQVELCLRMPLAGQMLDEHQVLLITADH